MSSQRLHCPALSSCSINWLFFSFFFPPSLSPFYASCRDVFDVSLLASCKSTCLGCVRAICLPRLVIVLIIAILVPLSVFCDDFFLWLYLTWYCKSPNGAPSLDNLPRESPHTCPTPLPDTHTQIQQRHHTTKDEEDRELAPSRPLVEVLDVCSWSSSLPQPCQQTVTHLMVTSEQRSSPFFP